MERILSQKDIDLSVKLHLIDINIKKLMSLRSNRIKTLLLYRTFKRLRKETLELFDSQVIRAIEKHDLLMKESNPEDWSGIRNWERLELSIWTSKAVFQTTERTGLPYLDKKYNMWVFDSLFSNKEKRKLNAIAFFLFLGFCVVIVFLALIGLSTLL